jgi:short-subunit dehydrogenase
LHCAQAVKDELSSTCKDIEIIPLDLCGPYAGLEAAAAAADGAFNGAGVDYLVHNAGASMSALASEVSPEVTDALFGVNTLGPIKLTRAALPSLLARNKARIVVVASMAGKVPSPGQAIYSGGQGRGGGGRRCRPAAMSATIASPHPQSPVRSTVVAVMYRNDSHHFGITLNTAVVSLPRAACKMGLYGYFATLATELADTGVKVTICCPGPVAAAEGAAPRSVYGATGLVNTQAAKSEKDDKARMKPEVGSAM